MPPTTVSSAVVKEEDWAPVLSAVGSISAVQGAMVSTELGGVVAKVEFSKRRRSKKRRNPVEARFFGGGSAVAHGRSRSWNWRGQICSATRDLAARKVVSKQELDAAQSAFGQKKGSVDNMRSFMPRNRCARHSTGSLAFVRSTLVNRSTRGRTLCS